MNVHKFCFLELENYLFSLILSLMGFFIQRLNVYDVSMLGNKHCRYNQGPLYNLK